MGSNLHPLHPPGTIPSSLPHLRTERLGGERTTLTVRHTRPVPGTADRRLLIPADRRLAALAAGHAKIYREQALRMGIALEEVEVTLTPVRDSAHVTGTVRLTGRGARRELARLDAEVQRRWPLGDLIATLMPARPEPIPT